MAVAIEPPDKNPIAYAGEYSGTEPCVVVEAVGWPAGGAFEWVQLSSKYGLVGSQGHSIIDVRGCSPSMQKGDASLKVKYTYEGYVAEDVTGLTVSNPASTTCTAGAYGYAYGGRQRYRDFYHVVKDQFHDAISIPGIPCWELVVPLSGATPHTTISSSVTQDHGAQYGVSLKDRVTFPVGTPDSESKQTLIIGGWWAAPDWRISLDNISDPSGAIYKTGY